MPIWNSAASDDAKLVGFIPADGDYSRSVMRAFLSGDFLLSRDYGVDVRIVSVDAVTDPTEATLRFQWKLSTQRTYNPEVITDTSAANNGLYLTRQFALHLRPDGANTGLFIYFDATTKDALTAAAVAGDRYWFNVTGNDGLPFLKSDSNTAHQFAECSGRGICERATGTCSCIAGYTGDACQRTVCPNDCSGHGVCQSEAYFVADAVAGTAIASNTYTAFDADSNYGCKCDDGFRASDCSARECPSGDDPLKGDGGANGLDCSGRGVCDYTTGLCGCFKGFFGERCEEQSTLI